MKKAKSSKPVGNCSTDAATVGNNVDKDDGEDDAKENNDHDDTSGTAENVVAKRNFHNLPETLQNFYAVVPAAEKLTFLKEVLSCESSSKQKTILFFLTCACVDFYHKALQEL